MNNFQIKIKLYWLAGLIVIGLILLASLSAYSLSTMKNINVVMYQVKMSEIEILTLRKHEKDFLARLDLKYQQKFDDTLASLNTDTNTVSSGLNQIGLEHNSEMAELQADIQQYSEAFKNIVQINNEIGLNEKSGLRGALRDAVHAAEKEIKLINNSELLANMLMLRRNEKDFMLRRNEKYIGKFNKNYKILTQTLASADMDYKTKALIGKKMDAYHRMFIHFTDGYKRMGLSPELGLQGVMRDAVHKTEDVFSSLDEILQSDLKEQQDKNLNRLFLAVIVTIIAIVGLLFIISKAVISRLVGLKEHMSEVALASGDLTTHLDVGGKDEITEISQLFNQFVSNLHQTFVQIPGFTENLKQEAENNAQLSGKTYQLSIEQQNETDSAVTGVGQIVSASAEIAKNIHIAADSAAKANETAEAGRSEIQHVSHAMDVLATELQSSTELTKELDENSANISVVVEVIQGIAEQTNLLALNAAIEAARAGENGRGFAVVADEVRTLAQRTQESTQQIQSLIETLQINVKHTISVMREGSSKASSTAESTTKALDTLKDISAAVNNIFMLNSGIATAAEEQSVVSEEISTNMHSIDAKAKEMTGYASNSNKSSEQINTIAEKLQALISTYKL